MDLDDRELRLRSRFGFTLAWSAFAIVVPGALLGSLLQAIFSIMGHAVGSPGGHGETIVMMAGHLLVGLGVIATILRSYLAPSPRAGVESSG